MSKKAVMLWAWIDADVRSLVEKLAEAKGVSISEYVRQLVLDDLDRRNVFTAQLKEALRNG